MTPTGHDDEFELRLRRGERFVPQFDADLDGPDEAVDRAVLARARAAVLKPPVVEPRYHRAPRWTLPIALAATVLLSFTLVMQMDSRDVVAPRTAERADDATRAADAGMPSGVAGSAMQAEPEVRIDAPAASASATREAAAAPPAPGAAPRAAQPAPAPLSMPAAPPPPAPAPLASVATQRVTDAAPGAAAAAASDAAPRREAMGLPAASPPADDTADAWLARIEALRVAGDLAAARRELAAFRNRYPQAELPPALRPLLEP